MVDASAGAMVGPLADVLAAETAVRRAAMMVVRWGNHSAERSVALTEIPSAEWRAESKAAWLVDTMVVTMAATLVVGSAACLVDLSVAG